MQNANILKPIEASNANEGQKNFIIGKMWINSIDGIRPGAIRISRNLPANIILKAGSTLRLSPNRKREGKTDADFSVSILLPIAEATKMIDAEKANAASRKAATVA